MLELVRKSPVKIGIILAVLILLNIVGWYVYLNWETPLDEAIELATLTPESKSTSTISPTPEVIDTLEPTPTETPIPEDTPTPTIEPVCGEDTSMTILLMGIDTENYLYGLADSISLVRLDFQDPKVVVVSLPRDLWVDIPGASSHGVTQGKLNQAYFYGTEGMGFFDGPGYGAGLLADTLLNNFGFAVDHYLSVNKYAFRNIVDALGGVSVYLPEAVYIKHNFMPEPRLFLPAGYHNLNGAQAEEVVRARVNIGDFGRIQNQIQVIKGLANQMLTPSGITRIPALANQLRAYVLTDLSAADITQMACLAAHLNPEEDLIFDNVIPSDIVDDISWYVWDSYREEEVFALVYDQEIITQRLADFQEGIWPTK